MKINDITYREIDLVGSLVIHNYANIAQALGTKEHYLSNIYYAIILQKSQKSPFCYRIYCTHYGQLRDLHYSWIKEVICRI